MIDVYQTIAEKSIGIYKEKGSKFIAFAYPLLSETEFKGEMMNLKKEYNDARHHCYAFRFGVDMKNYRFSDDGEPNNTAGKPIFGQLQSYGLTNIGIIVVRYFGGTKLGVGGLITAYREAAKDAIEKAQIVNKTVNNRYEIIFDYIIMNKVMNFVKQKKVNIITQLLEEVGTIVFEVRQKEAEGVLLEMKKIVGIKIREIK